MDRLLTPTKEHSMKQLFLASSFADVADLFAAFAQVPLAGRTVTFIPTASLPEKVTFYVGAARKALQRLGLVIDELELSTASAATMAAKLRGNDFIYVSGGNTFFLLQILRQSGADKLLVEEIEAGKLFIGESAGAIVLAPDVAYVKPMDDIRHAPALTSCAGLGVVDFYPLPHHTNPPFKKTVEKILLSQGDALALRPFSNQEALVVRGELLEQLSGKA
ncbi:MAG: Type 1 glutamine amidotransferase-like domain-containing protein [Aeromonadaceae bacterium]|nr:Type 1 glutamine amidotransferase-like domain-containing protein [Aeromonadaceae bacterium]